MTPVIVVLTNARGSIRVMSGADARQGKKTEEGTMISPPDAKTRFDPMAAVDSPGAHTVTPATIKDGSRILTKREMDDCGEPRKFESPWLAGHRSLPLARRRFLVCLDLISMWTSLLFDLRPLID
jgi:hypothetical protein